MPNTFAPQSFAQTFLKLLDDESRPAYGQVSTIDKDGIPHTRTLHMRSIPEVEGFGFASNIRTQKWNQLKTNPALSGCLFLEDRHVQYRWTGDVRCIETSKATKDELTMLTRMWHQVRTTVREVYWLDTLGLSMRSPLPPEAKIETPSSNFSAVICLPTHWDVYELLSPDYRDHRRTRHLWNGAAWISEPVSLLSGLPIRA